MTSLPLLDHVAQRMTRKPVPQLLTIFPSLPLSGNRVIGGNWQKGGHALNDDKRLKRFIILVPLSPSYEEGFLAGHVVGCVFDLLLAQGKVIKWGL